MGGLIMGGGSAGWGLLMGDGTGIACGAKKNKKKNKKNKKKVSKHGDTYRGDPMNGLTYGNDPMRG